MTLERNPAGPGLLAKFALWHSMHWSRQFEWPWAVREAGLGIYHDVLDAAGGNGMLQYAVARRCRSVLNVDLDQKHLDSVSRSALFRSAGNIVVERADLRALPYRDGRFDRVFCVSALEHIDDPEACLMECYRVLKPGGILLATFDVASAARWNHTIDVNMARRLLTPFGLDLPPITSGTLGWRFDEIDPQPGEPRDVLLNVLCAKIVKGS